MNFLVLSETPIKVGILYRPMGENFGARILCLQFLKKVFFILRILISVDVSAFHTLHDT